MLPNKKINYFSRYNSSFDLVDFRNPPPNNFCHSSLPSNCCKFNEYSFFHALPKCMQTSLFIFSPRLNTFMLIHEALESTFNKSMYIWLSFSNPIFSSRALWSWFFSILHAILDFINSNCSMFLTFTISPHTILLLIPKRRNKSCDKNLQKKESELGFPFHSL
jgi:hypothetical protein